MFFKSKTCGDDSARTSLSPSPKHSLRSFNYLMQDAGIMLGRHLKECPAFIYWDGSSVRREERGLPECHEACLWFLQRHTYPCLFSLAFSFFLSLSACLQCTLHHKIFLHFRGGTKAPRTPQVPVRVDRSTWGGGGTTTVISHFSTCCSQVHTRGNCCTVSFLRVNVALNRVEPFEKRRGMSQCGIALLKKNLIRGVKTKRRNLMLWKFTLVDARLEGWMRIGRVKSERRERGWLSSIKEKQKRISITWRDKTPDYVQWRGLNPYSLLCLRSHGIAEATRKAFVHDKWIFDIRFVDIWHNCWFFPNPTGKHAPSPQRWVRCEEK